MLAPAGGQDELALCCAIALCSEGTSEYTPSIGLPIGFDFLPVSHGATNAAASGLSETAPSTPVAGDPRLHVLNFIMNVVATADGRDGAVRSIPTPRKLDDLRGVRWRRHSDQTTGGSKQTLPEDNPHCPISDTQKKVVILRVKLDLPALEQEMASRSGPRHDGGSGAPPLTDQGGHFTSAAFHRRPDGNQDQGLDRWRGPWIDDHRTEDVASRAWTLLGLSHTASVDFGGAAVDFTGCQPPP